jgi:hypothetical protein
MEEAAIVSGGGFGRWNCNDWLIFFRWKYMSASFHPELVNGIKSSTVSFSYISKNWRARPFETIEVIEIIFIYFFSSIS